MPRPSIFYRYPKLYKSGLKFLHGGDFDDRYKYMAGMVKGKEEVLEPGCGPVVLAKFLPKGATYMGFDANGGFVNHAKSEGWKVWRGNVLSKENYHKSDVVIVCDVYHHLSFSDRKKFIKLCWGAGKRLFIICEPGSEEGGVWRGLKRRVAAWGDRDGTNNVTAENYMTERELHELINDGFGAIPKSVRRVKKKFGGDIVTTFFRE